MKGGGKRKGDGLVCCILLFLCDDEMERKGEGEERKVMG